MKYTVQNFLTFSQIIHNNKHHFIISSNSFGVTIKGFFRKMLAVSSLNLYYCGQVVFLHLYHLKIIPAGYFVQQNDAEH